MSDFLLTIDDNKNQTDLNKKSTETPKNLADPPLLPPDRGSLSTF